ncbi:helix-turn-helix domain-containing protein [Actinomadura soli]|uniref:helix-turn-helix domain-containing protein n=1 Tax=Actinomadura soli TaxID=2508997 RepID=UPI00197AF987
MPLGYPPEFRRKVLDLVKAGRPVRQVAADLDMPSQTIYVWLRQRGRGPGTRRLPGRRRVCRGLSGFELRSPPAE